MIVTFTANPSVDRTAEVPELVRGAVIRAHQIRVDAGGKGINVTRALTANGHPSLAVLPSGGAEGAQLRALLEAQQLWVRAVPIVGAVRANVTIVEPDGTTTKINEPGPELSVNELSDLTAALLEAAGAGADWVVLSGSLPPGVPAELYASLTERLHEQGVRVALDTSGSLLRAAVAGAPDLIKPNDRELEQASGVEVKTPADVLEAVAALREAGARDVLASLGADGAVLVDQTGAWHASAPVAVPRSTVGAGDSMLAGFLAAGGRGPEALVEGVAWATAAVSLPGSRMPVPAEIDRSVVHVNPITINLTEVAQ
ncbi:MAG: 1-phosphofructokinase [Solirubrobacteraceae bacterium]